MYQQKEGVFFMPANDQQWAAFFTGKYSLLVDDSQAFAAELRFSRTGTPHLLQVSIQSAFHDWNDTGDSRFALKSLQVPGYGWPRQGNLLPGGHMLGTLSHHSYGHIVLLLQCWELVNGEHGFKPDGKGVVIRFEGKTDKDNKVWFSFSGGKDRPDTNYPWNLG
jgi:hypothetical protein